MGKWSSQFTQIRTTFASINSSQFWCTASNYSNQSAGSVRCFRPNDGKANVKITIFAYGKWK